MKIAIIPVTPFQQNCTLIWDETTHAPAVAHRRGDVHHRAGVVGRVAPGGASAVVGAQTSG